LFYDKIRKKWRVQKRVGNKRPSRYFDDHLEGQIFELQLKAGHVKFEAKPTTGKGCTFDAFSERWLKEYCRVEKAESQWKEDASVIKHHLSPAFGALLISSLKKSHLIELKATLREKTHGKRSKPLSAKSINNIVALAKKMLSAETWTSTERRFRSGRRGAESLTSTLTQPRTSRLKMCR
jgi:hypothetical protein